MIHLTGGRAKYQGTREAVVRRIRIHEQQRARDARYGARVEDVDFPPNIQKNIIAERILRLPKDA